MKEREGGRKEGEGNGQSKRDREREREDVQSERERGRVRINCTARPNCPGRINTGVHARVDSPWRIPFR